MNLQCFRDMQCVRPELVKVLELICVQQHQNDHRIDDDNQPEDVHELLPRLARDLHL